MSSLREEKEELIAFIKHPVWQRVLNIASSQIKARTDNIILCPLQNEFGIYEQEFAKGEVSGVKLFCQMPELLLEETQSQLDQFLKEENDEDKTSAP